MPTERDQPWWADAQEYRHRDSRRRDAGDASSPSEARAPSRPVDRVASRSEAHGASRFEDEYSAGAARRRRAAAARASAQERRARQRRPEPEEFGWVDESPFAPSDRSRDRERVERDNHRRARERARQPQGESPADRPGTSLSRRPGARPPVRRRRGNGILARPEKLLLYVALVGLFLVLAAVSNSDAAVVVHHAASSR